MRHRAGLVCGAVTLSESADHGLTRQCVPRKEIEAHSISIFQLHRGASAEVSTNESVDTEGCDSRLADRNGLGTNTLCAQPASASFVTLAPWPTEAEHKRCPRYRWNSQRHAHDNLPDLVALFSRNGNRVIERQYLLCDW